MADLIRTGLVPRSRTTALPAVGLDDGRSAVLSQFGSTMLGYSQYFGGKAQEEAQRDAKKLAEEQGADPNIELKALPSMFRTEDTKTNVAYNTALKAAYSARIRTALQRKSLQLETQFPVQPNEQAASFAVFSDSIKETMPGELIPEFDLLVATTASGNVAAAVTKKFKIEQLNRDAFLEEALAVDGATARQLGEHAADGIDPTSAASLISMWEDRMAALKAESQRSPFFTEQMFQRNLTDYTSSTSRQFLQGLYDAAENKEAILRDIDNFEVTIPVLGPDGSSGEINMVQNLTEADRDTLQTYVAGQYNRNYTLETRDRDEFERLQKENLRLSKREVARSGDLAAAQSVFESPFATPADIDKVNGYLQNGVGSPIYAGGMLELARQGKIRDVDETDLALLDFAQRDAIQTEIDKWDDEHHYSKNRRYQEADDMLLLQLAGVTGDITAAAMLSASDSTKARLAAAGALRGALIEATDQALATDKFVGRGAAGDTRPITGQDGKVTHQEVFDPMAWVTTVLARIDDEVSVITTQINDLQSEITKLRTEAFSGGENAKAAADDMVRKQALLSEMRKGLGTQIDVIIERTARGVSRGD